MAYTWFVLQEKDANYFDQQHLMGMTPIFNCCYTDPYFEKIYGPVFFFSVRCTYTLFPSLVCSVNIFSLAFHKTQVDNDVLKQPYPDVLALQYFQSPRILTWDHVRLIIPRPEIKLS